MVAICIPLYTDVEHCDISNAKRQHLIPNRTWFSRFCKCFTSKWMNHCQHSARVCAVCVFLFLEFCYKTMVKITIGTSIRRHLTRTTEWRVCERAYTLPGTAYVNRWQRERKERREREPKRREEKDRARENEWRSIATRACGCAVHCYSPCSVFGVQFIEMFAMRNNDKVAE